jgi:hypothetical protein
MNGVPVDTRSEEFKVMYQNFIAYCPSIVLETMSELDKIISEEIKNDIRSEHQVLGPFPACIDSDAKQALDETGPNQQGVELFDCETTPLTLASNGAL